MPGIVVPRLQLNSAERSADTRKKVSAISQVTTTDWNKKVVDKTKKLVSSLVEAAGSGILAGVLMAAVYVGIYHQNMNEVQRRIDRLEAANKESYTKKDADLLLERTLNKTLMIEKEISEIRRILDKRDRGN